MFTQRVCSFSSVTCGLRDGQGQPGSQARHSGSPGDAVELKECVTAAQSEIYMLS